MLSNEDARIHLVTWEREVGLVSLLKLGEPLNLNLVGSHFSDVNPVITSIKSDFITIMPP